MIKSLALKLDNELQAVCKQAESELMEGYDYFIRTFDYNAICIVFEEIHLIRGYTVRYTLPSEDGLPRVPNTDEFGFFDSVHRNAYEKADPSILKALEQRGVRSNDKLFVKNGCFYGYFCYNVYSKILGWVQNVSKKYSVTTSYQKSVIDYLSASMEHFMRFENRPIYG